MADPVAGGSLPRHSSRGSGPGAASDRALQRRWPAKLSPRRAAEGAERGRLFQRLDDAATLPLICVHGPAGSGKSMLVASWLAHHRMAALWYRVDDADADAATVFSFLALGAAGVTRKRRLALPALTPEYLLDLPGFTRRFFRLLFAALPPGAALVFDGIESAPGAVLHQLLLLAVEEVPAGQRLVLTSREAPAEKLAHLLAKGSMGAIGWDDLRLTLEEATVIAAGGSDVPQETLQRLHAAADGWAAGFILLLAHWRRTRSENVDSDAELAQQLFPYYVNELFARADDSTRNLLLRTSLLPTFSRDQAATLVLDANVDEVLQRLLQRNFFIERSPGPRPVHRYHPLFRDFLREQARRLLSAGEYREVQVQAAGLLLAEGESEAALSLLIDAQAWAQAAGLVCRLAPGLLQQGRFQTLLGLAAAIPPGTDPIDVWLQFWRALALLPLMPAKARALLQAAWAGFVRGDDRLGQALTCAAILDSWMHEWSDIREVDSWADELQRLLAELGGRMPADVEIRIVCSAMVLVFRGPRHAALVESCFRRALLLLPRLAENHHRMLVMTFVVMIRYLRGEWAAGLAFVAETEATLPPFAQAPLHLAIWHALKARLQIWSGDCAAAFASATLAEKIAENFNVRVLASITASAGAFAALNADDPERAALWFDRMKAGVQPNRLMDVATIDFQQGLIDMARGQSRLACEHLRAGVDKALDCGAELLAAQFRIALAQARIQIDELEAAERELQSVMGCAEAAGLSLLEHGALMTRAWLRLRGGELGQALEVLRLALTMGRKSGHRMVFPWAPVAMLQELGRLALEHGFEQAHVHELLSLREVPPPPPDVERWPWPIRVLALGRFEILLQGQPLSMSAKAPKKPFELLKALLALGADGVATGSLVQHLWPDLDGDAAHNAFNVALHRLRRLLGDERAVVLHDSRLTLDRQRVWTDIDAFGLLADRVADEIRSPTTERLLALYRDHFLPDDEAPWVLAQRERLRGRMLRAVSVLAQRLERAGQIESLVILQRRVIELDPLAEPMHRGLMLSLHALGRTAEALDAYERCQDILQRTQGTQPSRLTEQARMTIEQGR